MRAEKKVLNKDSEHVIDSEFGQDILEDRSPDDGELAHSSSSVLDNSPKEETNLRENLEKLIGNKEFWCICFSLTGLFLVVTGIQYWLPTYLKTVYLLSEDEAAIFYTTTSITGPIAGVIVGGIITTYFGGYNTYKSHRL
jgi:sugar phosphate permease